MQNVGKRFNVRIGRSYGVGPIHSAAVRLDRLPIAATNLKRAYDLGRVNSQGYPPNQRDEKYSRAMKDAANQQGCCSSVRLGRDCCFEAIGILRISVGIVWYKKLGVYVKCVLRELFGRPLVMPEFRPSQADLPVRRGVGNRDVLQRVQESPLSWQRHALHRSAHRVCAFRLLFRTSPEIPRG